MSKTFKAEIVHHKKQWQVRIRLGNKGPDIYAYRDQQQRITYSRPERVPRVLKNTIVPELFKEIDRRAFGRNVA